MSQLLKFAKGNAKLGKNVFTFSLPSGFSCPGANECLSKANRATGKLTDGPENKFRCFSASQENIFPCVRNARWHNFDLLREALKKGYNWTSDLIIASLPKKADLVRIHVAGDFFSEDYFCAWLVTAQNCPEKTFYFYTKSLHYWTKYLELVGNGHTRGSVRNFIPTASYGGKHDNLIKLHNLRYASVVFSVSAARKLRLPIDHDDSHAMKVGRSFALLLHGQQPKDTIAAKAWYKLRKEGNSGYSRDDRNRYTLPLVGD